MELAKQINHLYGLLEKTKSNKNEMIQKIAVEPVTQSNSMRISNSFRNVHLDECRKVDLENISIPPDDIPLCSTEKYFLRYLRNKKVNELESIAAYWTYEHNLIYKELIPRFISSGYLEISYNSKYFLSYLSVSELKTILKNLSLPVSGNKAELLKRIPKDIPNNTLRSFIDDTNDRFVITYKGCSEIESLSESIIRHLELEDCCIMLLSNHQISEAYNLICQYELSKNLQRGLGINWEKELKNGLSSIRLSVYNDFLQMNIDNDLPTHLISYSLELKVSIILSIFLGRTSMDTMNLFLRITNLKITKEEISSIFYQLTFNLHDKININSLIT